MPVRKLRLETLESRRLMACGPNAPRREVTIAADVLDPNDGEWSLREAILEANRDSRCNVILLGAQTYELSLAPNPEQPNQDEAEYGDLDIDLSSGLDLRGAGAEQSIIAGVWPEAGYSDRLIEVNRGAIVSIDNVTLRGGKTDFRGGAIRSVGKLTLFDSVLHDNSALWGGAISIETAAAATEVTAEITDTYIHSNHADAHGGGISHTGGKLNLLRSTVAFNSAGLRGGGISVSEGTAALTNATIYANSSQKSGGGLSVTLGSQAVLINATVYRNQARGTTAGGGIDAATDDDLVTLENSIVAGNAAWHERNENELLLEGMNIRGNVQSDGSNLFGDVLGAVSPQIRQTDLVYRDPLLGLFDYFGGKTPGLSLTAASAAINAGVRQPTTPATDQAGALRCGAVDIGAMEYKPAGNALDGDSNGDGRVDLEDLNNVRNHFGERGECVPGDAGPFDNQVDLADLNSVRNNFGLSTSETVTRVDVTEGVPCSPFEPGTCAIPNDGLDDTHAIQFALNYARLQGETQVYLPAGRFEAAGLVMYGHALSLVGPGRLYLTDGSDANAVLTVYGEADPYGKEAKVAFTQLVPTRDGFLPSNWIDELTIDGNPAAAHTGQAMGLVVEGDSLLVSNVTVRNGELDPRSFIRNDLPNGINIVIRGHDNFFYHVDSRNAGHTAFRNRGDDNYYVDISAINFGCRGFRAQLEAGDLKGGAIFIHGAPDDVAVDFETQSNGSQCRESAAGPPYAPAAILIDPVPADNQTSGQRISRFELFDVDIDGPDRIDDETGQGALLKIAAVDGVDIRRSTFKHTNARLDSIRIAEGNGTIEIRDSWLARNLFFETSDPPTKRLDMSGVVIGAGFANRPGEERKNLIDGLRVEDFFIGDALQLIGFSEAAIRWVIPDTRPVAGMTITNSSFRANLEGSDQNVAYALTVSDPHPDDICGRLRGWFGNSLEPGDLTQPTPDDFPCNLVFNGPPPTLAATPLRIVDQAIERWDAGDLLLGSLLADGRDMHWRRGTRKLPLST